jgi:hypothetical protein
VYGKKPSRAKSAKYMNKAGERKTKELDIMLYFLYCHEQKAVVWTILSNQVL